MTRAQPGHTPKRSRAHQAGIIPPAAGAIHLVVDLNRCQAYAQCCFLAPSVFQLHGEEALWYDPSPDAAQRESVLRAAAACPVQAIQIELSEPAHPQHSQHRKHTEHRKDTEHREQREKPHAAQRS